MGTARARLTLIAGLLVALASFAGLLANEGLFLPDDRQRIQLNISGFECNSALSNEPYLRVGIANATFTGLTADVVLDVDMRRFVNAGCQFFEIKPRRPVIFDDQSPHFDYSPFRTTTYNKETLRFNGDYFKRTAEATGSDGIETRIVATIPGAFRRVGADTFATRISMGGLDEVLFIESHGQRGGALDNDWETDIVFSLSEFSRLSSLMAIILATFLGAGIGAVFEAVLMLATARRLGHFEERLRSRLKGETPSRRGGETQP